MIGLKMITDGLLRGAGDMTIFTISNLVNLGDSGGVCLFNGSDSGNAGGMVCCADREWDGQLV